MDDVVEVLDLRVKESGRSEPVPKLSDRALLRLEKEAAKQVLVWEVSETLGRALKHDIHL